MPPKKNGKGNGDKSLKKESTNPEQKTDEELTESDKNFYRAQIRDLEERLERCESLASYDELILPGCLLCYISQRFTRK